MTFIRESPFLSQVNESVKDCTWYRKVFGKWAGGSGGFAMFTGGISKAANFITKWAPKVITGVKDGNRAIYGRSRTIT